MLQAATACGVAKAVVLSTDKAAYPINVMGMTKALSEKIMVARSRVAAQKKLTFCGTRYGNVMASRGSVIPLFLQQIDAGKPLTLTDPHMTRFMMSLEDAVESLRVGDTLDDGTQMGPLISAGPRERVASFVADDAPVAVDDPAVIDDLNTPEDYERLVRELNRDIY